ncbi:MAG: twin-arginine translocation signal domain-containing protein [Acidobacteria bacterium]|nr:twin-arginine translocation signal domain-containing protein [Acidobacteriota bacterium]
MSSTKSMAGHSRREFLARSGVALGAVGFALSSNAPAWGEVDPAIYARAEAKGFPKPKFVQTNVFLF